MATTKKKKASEASVDSTVEAQSFNGPNPETLIEFYNYINDGLSALQAQNPDVPAPYLMKSVFNVFLTFPFGWFMEAGHVDKFTETLQGDIKEFYELSTRARNITTE